MTYIHPARLIPFDQLYRDLCYAAQEGVVYEHKGVGDMAALRLYTYSDETVYSRAWSEIALMARGLILDIDAKVVVATPFPKFFNVQEAGVEGKEAGEGVASMKWLTIPDLPFETFEKLDGSLIIIYWWGERWRCATKGSLTSDQAKWADDWLTLSLQSIYQESRPKTFLKNSTNYYHTPLDKTTTYLAEAVYPENKIVVNYSDARGLYLLGAYKSDGTELEYGALVELSKKMYWPVVERVQYLSISELLEKAKVLDCNSEGWVLRFNNGLRLKIKGEEYCRVHRMISNLTPLGVWRVMSEDIEGCGG